jgi:diguanylate cyclase (GGDEF)-like protein
MNEMAGELTKPSRDRNLQIVSQYMAKLEVTGLPRNYELFHEALTGADAALTREILTLQGPLSQARLDEIGIRHQLPAFLGMIAATRAQDTELLLDLVETIAEGAAHKHAFSRALEAVARSLRDDSPSGIADLQSEIDYLKASLTQTLLAEKELGETLKEAADRLMATDRSTACARRASLRDRLTGLPNHAALTERLEAFYEPGSVPQQHFALFLVSLKDLADLQQTYGHAAASRVIRKAASIFRRAIKKNDFLARIGDNEFAFLFADVQRDAVRAIADRLRSSIADNLIFAASDGGHTTTIELSIGAGLSDEAHSPVMLRQQAMARV